MTSMGMLLSIELNSRVGMFLYNKKSSGEKVLYGGYFTLLHRLTRTAREGLFCFTGKARECAIASLPISIRRLLIFCFKVKSF